MAITLISNVGFTEINTSGTLNTVAGIKDNLPVQFYKVVNNINGQLVIDNNDNHKKLILDINGKTINGENQSAIVYNGNDTLEIKGQGLITSGGTVRVSANGSGSYNATPTLGDGTVVITMTIPNFDITFNENYTQLWKDNYVNPSPATVVRTPDNIPSGETWQGLTGTNGVNINGLTCLFWLKTSKLPETAVKEGNDSLSFKGLKYSPIPVKSPVVPSIVAKVLWLLL